MYQFIKPFLDKKMPIFEEYGAFKYGIYANSFVEKKKLFSKHTCELHIVLIKTVNILTTNELVKNEAQVYIFLISPLKHTLWILIRNASLRFFLRILARYVFVGK